MIKKTAALPLPPKALVDGSWLGLVVDDEEGSRTSVRLALAGEKIFGRPIELEFADSAAAAKAKLSVNGSRFVFAIVDMVMEEKESGLELVDWIRSRPDLLCLRVAIRTGYAGGADPKEMIQKYDILDFRDKSDLTRGKLLGLIATLARSWVELQSARAGESAMEELARGAQALAECESHAAFVSALNKAGKAALAPWGYFEAKAHSGAAQAVSGIEAVRAQGLPDLDVSFDASTGWPSQAKVAKQLMGSARAAYGNLAERRKLEALAYADSITGLPNRRRLVQWMERDAEARNAVGTMIVDFDYFKRVNDRLGHEAGDKLLKVLGERMAAACQKQPARAARLAGDEFCVLFNAESADAAAKQAADWLARLGDPVHLGFDVLEPRFSAGLFWSAGVSPTKALRNADLAMYQAKRTGRGRLCLHTSENHINTAPKRARELRLAEAVASGEMVALYQPAVDDFGECVAFEMFVSWRQPDGSLIAAADFLPLAQEARVARDLDLWMAAEACRGAEKLGPTPQIRLNVDSEQLAASGFAQDLIRAWAGHPPGAFAVEMMESAALPDVEKARQFAAAMSQEGHEVCLDNFGSGSGSMGVLGRLNLGSVKIDASLTRGHPESSARRLGESACKVASIHGLRCLAINVRSPAEAAQLALWGACAFQGPGVGEPMELEQASAWLTRWRQEGRSLWMARLARARTEEL